MAAFNGSDRFWLGRHSDGNAMLKRCGIQKIVRRKKIEMPEKEGLENVENREKESSHLS
uniref:Uncharacterized protein n=1 Tax=Globodera rostochiensis TaxID=31243 RepID=A0A914HFX4_GLORO